MRSKKAVLADALTGRFTDHHGFLARVMLDRIDACTATEDRLSAQIEAMVAPFRRQLQLIEAVPGVGPCAAQIVLAEIGADMSRFSTAADLVSWAGMCPGNNQSGTKVEPAATRHGDPWLKAALGLSANAASHSKGTYLAARFRRIASRRGKKRALVAVGHSILVSIRNMLSHDLPYRDLGPDHFTDRLTTQGKARRIHQLLGRLATLASTSPCTQEKLRSPPEPNPSINRPISYQRSCAASLRAVGEGRSRVGRGGGVVRQHIRVWVMMRWSSR